MQTTKRHAVAQREHEKHLSRSMKVNDLSAKYGHSSFRMAEQLLDSIERHRERVSFLITVAIILIATAIAMFAENKALCRRYERRLAAPPAFASAASRND